MSSVRPLHPDFEYWLAFKNKDLIELYKALRELIILQYPDANELLYHTHALVSGYSLTHRVSEAYCMIPVYTNHLNLGFYKGTLLSDPDSLLKGTGKFIRHIPIKSMADLQNDAIENMIRQAIEFEMKNLDVPIQHRGETFSRIKSEMK